MLLVTFSIDVKQKLNDIENKIKSSITKNGKLSIKTQIEIKKDVHEVIRFHADTKQLSKPTISVFQIMIILLIYNFSNKIGSAMLKRI